MIDGHGWRRTRGMRGVRTVGATFALAGLLAAGTIGNANVVKAQDMATPEESMPAGVPTVSVSGHGQVNVPPDTASVSIGIDVIQPTLGQAQEQATAQATTLIEALKAARIADEDIQTAYLNVSILRDYSENGDPT
jgi:uncharacterized protein YggE